MTATVHKFRRPARIECSACGATRDAACDCGVAYVLAGTRAAQAVAKSPEKSDRAIAAEIGVSDKTVGKARKAPAEHSAPEKRVGKDGKKYPAKPKPKAAPRASDPIQDDCADCDTPEQHWQRSFSNLAGDAIAARDYWTRQFGKWETFEVPSSLVTLAKQAAKVWTKLAADLAK